MISPDATQTADRLARAFGTRAALAECRVGLRFGSTVNRPFVEQVVAALIVRQQRERHQEAPS